MNTPNETPSRRFARRPLTRSGALALVSCLAAVLTTGCMDEADGDLDEGDAPFPGQVDAEFRSLDVDFDANFDGGDAASPEESDIESTDPAACEGDDDCAPDEGCIAGTCICVDPSCDA